MAKIEEPSSGRKRALWLVFALTSLVVGILVLFWPTKSLLVLALLFGIELIVAGGVRIALAVTDRESRGRMVFGLIMGFLTIGAGVVCLVLPGASLLILALTLAIGWLLDGVAEIVVGLQPGRPGKERFATVLFGAVSVIAGLVFLIFPAQTLLLLARFGGAALIVFAILALVVVIVSGRRSSAPAQA